MGNSLRCCLACILPCGALDLIRIVHLNGHVEEITHPITAGEVLKNNPNHVLSKPSSQGMVRRILILSPESELKRGSIYFLIPAPSVPEKKRRKKISSDTNKNASTKTAKSRATSTAAVVGDRSVTAAEKKSSSSRRDRRSCKAAEWRPHLESIFED
ncbi:PREDICTED: uncharacterized protein LOC109173701 [Ipomoea nil]|uniref:uncharacterized protein LOC109173701 n=1 Tax=Ipomoea nil TaxID=35883 RepID=UPI0009018B6A|nr:PREDICTED: uncharacterized protein LOC109173701 [Ipomoea nil]